MPFSENRPPTNVGAVAGTRDDNDYYRDQDENRDQDLSRDRNRDLGRDLTRDRDPGGDLSGEDSGRDRNRNHDGDLGRDRELDRDRQSTEVASQADGQPRWATAALLVAGLWSVAQLVLGLTWLMAPNALSGTMLDNPFNPAVDAGGDQTSLLTGAGAHISAVALTVIGALGLLLTAVMTFASTPKGGRKSWWRTVVMALAGVLSVCLAVLLPDYRLIATIGYTPVIAVEQLVSANPRVTLLELYNQTTNAMILMTLAGVAFAGAAVAFGRRMRAACPQCGRTDGQAGWTSPASAARWGRWAVTVAIVIPVGYAITRWAWALGIPLGVSQDLLDEIDSYVWMGAALGTMAIGGAILTLGLVQHWGEVFPRWIPGLRGHRVPISLAVVPALLVSVVVASAGAMFGRMALTGQLENSFPGSAADLFAWLPEIFWPLWGAALGTAAIAYWLRRRGVCPRCGRGESAIRDTHRTAVDTTANVRDTSAPEIVSGRPATHRDW